MVSLANPSSQIQNKKENNTGFQSDHTEQVGQGLLAKKTETEELMRSAHSFLTNTQRFSQALQTNQGNLREAASFMLSEMSRLKKDQIRAAAQFEKIDLRMELVPEATVSRRDLLRGISQGQMPEVPKGFTKDSARYSVTNTRQMLNEVAANIKNNDGLSFAEKSFLNEQIKSFMDALDNFEESLTSESLERRNRDASFHPFGQS